MNQLAGPQIARARRPRTTALISLGSPASARAQLARKTATRAAKPMAIALRRPMRNQPSMVAGMMNSPWPGTGLALLELLVLWIEIHIAVVIGVIANESCQDSLDGKFRRREWGCARF